MIDAVQPEMRAARCHIHDGATVPWMMGCAALAGSSATSSTGAHDASDESGAQSNRARTSFM